jgi:hypothetical protein
MAVPQKLLAGSFQPLQGQFSMAIDSPRAKSDSVNGYSTRNTRFAFPKFFPA